MTIKKFTVIAAAGAALLAGAIGISMRLTSPNEMEMEVPETPVEQGTPVINEDGFKTLGDMENIPLYYDDTEVLLLPLRNVMEGLGGSVEWNAETKSTEVSYRGRTLALKPGEEQATLNGYEVTLPDAAEMINGCLYADEKLLSAYYTDEVDFDVENRQVTLQTKDNSMPLVAVKQICGEKDGKKYNVEVPVIVGLNDSKYEKNLNESLRQEMQTNIDAFLEEGTETGELQLKIQTGMCRKEFLSLWWEGAKDDVSVNLAKNYDLLGQKAVTLADILGEVSLAEVKKAAGEGWTEDRFYLTETGGLVLLKGSNESSLEMYHCTTESKQLEWQKRYGELFQKKKK